MPDIRKMDTPDNRDFWNFVETTSADVCADPASHVICSDKSDCRLAHGRQSSCEQVMRSNLPGLRRLAERQRVALLATKRRIRAVEQKMEPAHPASQET